MRVPKTYKVRQGYYIVVLVKTGVNKMGFVRLGSFLLFGVVQINMVGVLRVRLSVGRMLSGRTERFRCTVPL